MTIANLFNNLFKNKLFPPSFQPSFSSKSIKKEENFNNNEKNDLLFRLNDTKTRMYIVENAFNHELKFDLIDAHIHEFNSLKLQYSHLIKQAKELNISNNFTLEEEY